MLRHYKDIEKHLTLTDLVFQQRDRPIVTNGRDLTKNIFVFLKESNFIHI